MQGWNLFQAAVDGLAEFGEGLVVSTVEHVTFDEFPEPFDQIQIRGVRWQELQGDCATLGNLRYFGRCSFCRDLRCSDRTIDAGHGDSRWQLRLQRWMCEFTLRI